MSRFKIGDKVCYGYNETPAIVVEVNPHNWDFRPHYKIRTNENVTVHVLESVVEFQNVVDSPLAKALEEDEV